MAAVSNSSDFPNFAELCRTAREMEKNILAVPPSQISGALNADDSGSIFPKEYEQYTFAYMLSEAYKVERNIFASSYKPAMSGSGKPESGAMDQKFASELHKFVSRDVQGVSAFPKFQSPQQQEPKAPSASQPTIPGIPLPVPIPFLGKQSAQKPGVSEAAPLPPPPPDNEDGGKTPYEVEEFEKSPKREFPQETPKAQERASLIPEEEEEPLPMPEEEEAPLPEPEDEPEEKPEAGKTVSPQGKAAPKPLDKEDVWEEEKPQPKQQESVEDKLPKAARPTNSPSLSSSSKISPRLRAIIEEKMRRDEEREGKGKKEEETPFEREVAPEVPQEQGREIPLSSRERLLSKLEKSYPKQKMASEDFLESERSVSEEEHEVEEEKAAPKAEEDIWEEPKQPAATPKKKVVVAEYSRPEIEPAEQEQKEEAPAPSEKPPAVVIAPAREGYARPSAMNKGGLLIQPIFADDTSSSKPEEKATEQLSPQQQTDDARLKKIQRIIDELSPDRYKSAVSAPVQEEETPVAKTPKGRARGSSTEVNDDFSVDGVSGADDSREEEEAEPEKPQPKPPAKKSIPAPAPAPEPEEEEPQEEAKAEVAEPPEEELAPEQPEEEPEQPEEEPEPKSKQGKQVSAPSAKKAQLAKKGAKSLPSKKAAKQAEPLTVPKAKAGKQQPAAKKKGAAPVQKAPEKPLPKPVVQPKIVAQPKPVAQPTVAQPKSTVQSKPVSQQKGKPFKAIAKPPAKQEPKEPEPDMDADVEKAMESFGSNASEEETQKPLPQKKQLPVKPAVQELKKPLQFVARPQPRAGSRQPQSKPQADDNESRQPQSKPQAEDGGDRQQQGKPTGRILPPRQLPKQVPATGSSTSQPQVPAYAKDTSAVPSSSTKPGTRILPGGMAIPSAYQQTYVPPARQRVLPTRAQESRPTSAPQDEKQEDLPLEKKPMRVLPTKIPIRKPEPEPEPEEKTPEDFEQEKLRARTAESLRKKLQAPVPDEGPEEAHEKEAQENEEERVPSPDADDVPLPPKSEDSASEKPKSSLPSRPFQQSSREISGEAKLPEKDDDELSIPSPSQEDEPPEPAPNDYADAKQQFKRKIEQAGLKEEIRMESEETLEQYAKENMIWLYEIYKMGGMSREDFIEKVREQSGSHGEGQQSGGTQGEASAPPANPALESLNRELDKKAKK